MQDFFNEFNKRLVEATRMDFREILNQCGDEKIYAASFVTDSDAMTLFFAVNTYKKLEIRYEQFIQKYGDDEIDKESLYKAFKWNPSEWAYSEDNVEDSAIDALQAFLYEKRNSIEEEDFERFEENLYKTVTEVLLTLRNEGLFTDSILFVSISDDDRAEDIEDESAAVLNTGMMFDSFLNRWD